MPRKDEILFLPETPVIYLSMMRTQAGKPVGLPIWSSFEDRSDERNMQNEAMSSTFLSLSKSISDMAGDPEEDGKIIRLNVNNMTYNIFLAHPEDAMQLCFVVVFEEKNTVLVKDEYKTELVKLVTKTLRGIEEFQSFLKNDVQIRLNKGDALYQTIYDEIVKNITKWDKKRVKYLKDKIKEEKRLEEERQRALAAQQAKDTSENGQNQN